MLSRSQTSIFTAAVALGLSACSPAGQSIDKYGKPQTGVAPGDSRSIAKEVQTFLVTKVAYKAVHPNAYPSAREDDRLAPVKAQLLNSQQLGEFRDKGRVDVDLDPKWMPSEGQALVSLEIVGSGLRAEDMTAFDLSLREKNANGRAGRWELRLSPRAARSEFWGILSSQLGSISVAVLPKAPVTSSSQAKDRDETGDPNS